MQLRVSVAVTVRLPLTATFFVPADSPYISSYLNLSTTATVTKARPQLPSDLWTTACLFITD